MDSLLSLIDSRIDKAEKNSNALRSIPCKVIELLDNDYVKVQTIDSGSVYRVLNKSGTAVNVGEVVHVYYKRMLNNYSAYVGAAVNKSSNGDSQLENLEGDVTVGELFEEEREIASCGFKCGQATNCIMTLNFTLLGTVSSGVVHIKFYIDGVALSYSPINTTNLGQYISLSNTVPIYVSNGGEHEVRVTAYGDGNIISAMFNICGISISFVDVFDPTTDSDYIYYTGNNQTNVIYYVGASSKPSVPTTINGEQTTIIHATAFSNSNVKNVFIPEGVEEIE